ncbi:MAG: hypothetical protein HY023_05385, partial [Chloroflexi bacterium]|nr:hypothetical protein [Chloroflexota bacterium]
MRYEQIDALGRVLKSRQSTDGVEYPFTYTYNAAGKLESVQYPLTNRTLGYCYDQAGRELSVRNGGTAAADVYAAVKSGTDPENAGVTIAGYAAFGGMQRLELESGKYVNKWTYNARLQMGSNGLFYRSDAASTAFSMPAKMMLTLDYGAAAANNGNLASQKIDVAGFSATQVYGYDAVNRLETAVEGANWKQKFGYDRWGNRWIDETATSGMPSAATTGAPVGPANYDQTRNRWKQPDATQPDNAGNVTRMPGRTLKYDVENRLVSVDGSNPQTMVYDGDGRRVLRTAGGLKTAYVYMASGELAMESTSGSSVAAETGRRYLFADHLGSTRMMVDAVGVEKGWWDYAPFGEEIPASAGR